MTMVFDVNRVPRVSAARSHGEELAQPATLRTVLVAALMLPIGAGLTWAIWSLPDEPVGLAAPVAQQLPNSGVENPVTAVLLNFRSYDTLLEIGVLLLALIGVRFLRQLPRSESPSITPIPDVGPVLRAFAALIAPVAIVVAGYLLWVGAYAPGGAFQAGAVVAGAGVLMLLIDARRMRWLDGAFLRAAALVGFATFVTIAALPLLSGGALLQYPIAQAKWLILLIETAATISIAVVLVMLLEAIIGRRDMSDGGQGGGP